MSIRISRAIARLWKASADLKSATVELGIAARGTTDFPQQSGEPEIRDLIREAFNGANDASDKIVAALRLIDWGRMLADPEEGGNDDDGNS